MQQRGLYKGFLAWSQEVLETRWVSSLKPKTESMNDPRLFEMSENSLITYYYLRW